MLNLKDDIQPLQQDGRRPAAGSHDAPRVATTFRNNSVKMMKKLHKTGRP